MQRILLSSALRQHSNQRVLILASSSAARGARSSQLLMVKQCRLASSSSSSSAAAGEKKETEAPLPPSFVEAYKLNEPTRWVPLTIAGFGTAFATGLMHLNEEVQILGLFVLFLGTVYAKGGDAIGKYLDDTADAILQEHNALEDAQIESTKQVIAAYKRQMDIASDIQSIFAAQRTLMADVVAAQSLRLKHDVRNQVAKRLDNLLQAENTMISGIHTAITSNISAKARKAFGADGNAAMKASELEIALSALENPGKPLGKDKVGELISQEFASFRSFLESKRGTEIALSDEAFATVSDSVKAAARRDGLEHIPIEVPRKYKIDGVI